MLILGSLSLIVFFVLDWQRLRIYTISFGLANQATTLSALSGVSSAGLDSTGIQSNQAILSHPSCKKPAM